MFSALGFGKKKTPSGGDVAKHRDQTAQLTQWRSDVQRLQTTANKLAQDYSHHKGDFALGRYDELKGMIKTAVREYEAVMSDSQKRTLATSSRYAEKYNSSREKGAMSLLREHAASFATGPDRADKEAGDVQWADPKSKTVDEDIEKMKKEIIGLKKQYRLHRDKLDKLAKEYEDSKKYNPTQRYSILKVLIKDTIRV